MKITEFKFAIGNHFIAMEYYGLILNRTFLILVTEKELIGIKVHGLIGVEAPETNLLRLTVDGDLNNPYSYISMKYIQKIKEFDLDSTAILKADSANFRIKRAEIIRCVYDKSKKWGMGHYPHDGKVYVSTSDGKKREFIVLGNQSGQSIQDSLL